ncbi:TraR/DksA family transcriptional regulator [uncultured Jatrophihabitans sp.]|uniref:TraR/DksA family transcriptional regulator n=1 Tax=uncultured Jatrophihabitans sp. TaxID=1610747 RepID=UPI0035CAAD35
MLDSASSTTGDDEHDPEGATIGFERAQSVGSLRAAEAALAEVDAAVERVADGTYGRCVTCGRPIGDARLEARPATPYCIDHARVRA